MLRYLGLGIRELGDFPMPAHKRVNWEFLAVIRGKLAPFTENDRPTKVNRTLWLFPPGYSHGWTGTPGEKCQIVVLHFSSVPASLERVAAEQGYISIRLTPSDCKRLRNLAVELKPHYWQPGFLTAIIAEQALLELSLLILREVAIERPFALRETQLSRVIKVETWLKDRMAERSSIRDAAKAVGISTSQLARLFHNVRKESPKRAFDKLRVDRAMAIMAGTPAKLQSVADECGFSNASNFCRAFKSIVGSSPTKWRKETFIQYKKPSKKDAGDYTRHGTRRSLSL